MLRKHYRIKPRVGFYTTSDGAICLIPTIVYQYWKHRRIGDPIIAFVWLNMSICFGEWMRR